MSVGKTLAEADERLADAKNEKIDFYLLKGLMNH